MLWNWPWLRTRKVESPWKISPSGVFWFSERSGCTTWLTERLSAVIFSFDRSTWISRRTPPFTVTAATPSTRSKRGRDLVLRDLAQRDRVVLALDTDLRDRQLVRVELEDGGRVGVLGEPVAHAVHARAHFVGGFRQVGAPVEVEPDLTVAF